METPTNFEPIELTEKQNECWKVLQDSAHTEILYGGSAGGGKSLLGCLWILDSAIKYPETRYVIGRSKLKRLKETTLRTFFDLVKRYEMGSLIKYNSIDGVIKFFNGSEVLLKDLFHYPSDLNFDSLGSLECTSVFVDECNQVSHKAIDVLKSRIRYKLDEYGLCPKIFLTCNPDLNWVKTDFQQPWKDGNLKKYQWFTPALPSDNPHLPESYHESLNNIRDDQLRSRLRDGNWDFVNDPLRIFESADILSLWSNQTETGAPAITCDVARFGRDKTVIMVWKGLRIVKVVSMQKSSVPEVAKQIEKLSKKYSVRRSMVIVDEDGVGGGVCDLLPNSVGFRNGEKATDNKYQNLKSQCYFKLAELVADGLIGIDTNEHKDEIINELNSIRAMPLDTEQRARIEPKSVHKRRCGSSPDFADAVMMRMVKIVKRRTTNVQGFI